MSWKTILSKTELESSYVTVKKNVVETQDGIRIDDFYTVAVADAVAIVALTPDNQILLKREYRYSCGEDTIEVPAGTFEKSESDPLVVAKRELQEETGFTSPSWTYLGATRENTSKLTNLMHIFLARDCVKTDEQHLDETENVELIIVPIETAVDMIMNNKIHCNTSAHGILRVARMIGV